MFMHAIGIIYMGFLLLYLFACNAMGTVVQFCLWLPPFVRIFNVYFPGQIKFLFASARV